MKLFWTCIPELESLKSNLPNELYNCQCRKLAITREFGVETVTCQLNNQNVRLLYLRSKFCLQKFFLLDAG